MSEYKSNSHRSKEEKTVNVDTDEKKRVEKVVTGTVKTKKKGELSKLADIIAPGDLQNVRSYIFMDILIPAIKRAVSDIVTNGVDMILYPGGNPDRGRTNASKVSYRDYYSRRDDRDRSGGINARVRRGYSYDEIIFETRGDAEDVLTGMDELISSYGMASVADFYDLAGMTSEYTDNKYGWRNLRAAEVVRVRDGYAIKLPKAYPFD